MNRIEINGYNLPESFVKIQFEIYRNEFGSVNENDVIQENTIKSELNKVNKIIQNFIEDNEIILYTDHNTYRFIGIFNILRKDCSLGFFESMNNSSIDLAFKHFKQDALDRGFLKILGPINFNTYLSYRIRLNNPVWGKFDSEPHNPLYYNEIFTRNGFNIVQEYESRLIKKEHIKDVYINKKELLEALSQIPYNFIPINKEFWLNNTHKIFELIHQIFSGNPFYNTINFNQFNLLFNDDYINKLCSLSSVIFQDKLTQEFAAISLCMPNYESLNLENEKPDFTKHFALLENKTLLAKSVGVHPNYRSLGLMNYLGAYGMMSFHDHYDEVLFCTMRSDNPSLRFSDPFKYEKANYALYSCDLLKI